MMEVEAVLKQGLETGLDKLEDVFCPGPPEGTWPTHTDCSDLGVFFSWASHSSSLGMRIGASSRQMLSQQSRAWTMLGADLQT